MWGVFEGCSCVTDTDVPLTELISNCDTMYRQETLFADRIRE